MSEYTPASSLRDLLARVTGTDRVDAPLSSRPSLLPLRVGLLTLLAAPPVVAISALLTASTSNASGWIALLAGAPAVALGLGGLLEAKRPRYQMAVSLGAMALGAASSLLAGSVYLLIALIVRGG